MSESVYKVIELVGVSSESWDAAAAVAIEKAGKSLKDLRVGEVVKQDVLIEDGKPALYRVKMKISFKYHDDE